jgi:hypothetical protein
MGNQVEHEPTVRRRHDIPADISAADPFDPPDYVDLFVASVAGARDAAPEEWARATMEGADPIGRFLAWQTVLGLRLARGAAADHIAGWRIAERTPDWIRVEASSWIMSAHIVFLVEADTVSFATSVRYDRRLAGVVWPAVAVVHRAVAPGFLLGGVHRVLRRRPVSAG